MKKPIKKEKAIELTEEMGFKPEQKESFCEKLMRVLCIPIDFEEDGDSE